MAKPANASRNHRLEDESSARPFPFLRMNRRPPKPRARGLTEIRGPYYTPIGRRVLEDILECWSGCIDSFKFGGGSFALMPTARLRELIDLCHRYDVTVSTGGFVEYVLTQGRDAVARYIDTCRDLGFDTIEISAGFITIPADDMLAIVDQVRSAGMNPKPEISIQFGAGGASSAEELEAEGLNDVNAAIARARRCIESGVKLIMIESEGITESVKTWRTDVPAKFANALGLERVMFEASDPNVFAWYIKNFGPDVNLFVDHSQIVQLEALRCGTWGTKSLWGRVLTY
jgi:phosphosulfolactate synthase (CoM biosynthesis protein A)